VSRATQGEQDNYEMHVRAANIVSSISCSNQWVAHPSGTVVVIIASRAAFITLMRTAARRVT